MKRYALAQRVVCLLFVAGLFLNAKPAHAEVHNAALTSGQVAQTLDQAVRVLRSLQDKSGAWSHGGFRLGVTALAVLSLHAAGVPNDDPAIRRGVAVLRQLETNSRPTYEYSVAAMALTAINPVAYRREIRKVAEWLEKNQGGDGTWNYGGGDKGDNSNNQFAILGLRAASEAGIRIKPNILKRATAYFTNSQNGDGGWGYRKGGRSTGSMTAAGLSSLIVLGAKLQQSKQKCGEYVEDVRVASGLNWLAHNFSVDTNPGAGASWLYYYLYGMERVGIFSAKRYLGPHDWYRLGATKLENSKKGWLGNSNLPNLCFGILFLAKGNAPVAIQKLQWKGHKSPHRYDIKNITRFVSGKLKRPLSWRTVELSEPLDKLLAAPILFLNGHDAFRFDPQERAKLAAFIHHGGTLVAEACCNSNAFDKSFRSEIRLILGGNYKLRPLTRDHALYYAKVQMTPAQIRKTPLEGIDVSCKTSVIYAPKGISCEWDKGQNLSHPHFLAGLNMVSYVIGEEVLRSPLDRIEVVDEEGVKLQAGAFVFAQLRHEGDSNPHPVAGTRLMTKLARETGIPVGNETRLINPDSQNLYHYPFLYITGHNQFDLTRGGTTDAAIKNLRNYLTRGGFLLADPCCGEEAFSKSFKATIEKVFEGIDYEWKPIPNDHPIYTIRHSVQKVNYKEAVRREHPDLHEPVLYGVYYKESLVVVFTQYNIGCGIEEHTSPTCKGFGYQDAQKLMTNIILYAMTYN